MKKLIVLSIALVLVIGISACSKKQESLEDMQQPMSPEDLSRLSNSTQQATQSSTAVKPEVAQVVPAAPVKQVAPVVENLPPAGPYKPSNQEIQTALKNAGYYTYEVDGKLGPKSKKAIEEFQKANGLKADGKVGTKTWTALEKHLNATPAAGSSR
ncbi:hypothetical protein EPO66_02805 [bacterium]|nr:MAG: hypothetical protein EPO66_02805 [bacterium]